MRSRARAPGTERRAQACPSFDPGGRCLAERGSRLERDGVLSVGGAPTRDRGLKVDPEEEPEHRDDRAAEWGLRQARHRNDDARQAERVPVPRVPEGEARGDDSGERQEIDDRPLGQDPEPGHCRRPCPARVRATPTCPMGTGSRVRSRQPTAGPGSQVRISLRPFGEDLSDGPEPIERRVERGQPDADQYHQRTHQPTDQRSVQRGARR